ncbi:MAG: hypothetical protein K0A90_01965 [Methanosarcinaceae archaeon]|nr:hypothetical protein [Methanosarcinaceae archaeon]
MARKLSDTDLQIMHKLVPELTDDSCSSSHPAYRSILPPVSNRYSSSDDDFKERLSRLTEQELEYIVGLIFDGMECLNCVQKSHIGILLQTVSERLSKERSEDLKEMCGIFDF